MSDPNPAVVTDMLLEAGYHPKVVERMLRAVDGQVEHNLALTLIELGASDCPHCGERINEPSEDGMQCQHFAATLYWQLWPQFGIPKRTIEIPKRTIENG